MNEGKIKWYDEVKGYGFIQNENGEDIFVHRSGLEQANQRLETGQKVSFETKEGDKGTIAVNVKVIE